jgi:hypothetical protein
LDIVTSQATDISFTMDATFGDHNPILWEHLSNFSQEIGIHFEGCQITTVYSDDECASFERSLSFFATMDLYQRLHM